MANNKKRKLTPERQNQFDCFKKKERSIDSSREKKKVNHKRTSTLIRTIRTTSFWLIAGDSGNKGSFNNSLKLEISF